MSELLLDKKVKGPFYRDPEILFPIARPEIGIPIYGFDLWRAYEFSWLNPSGKPVSGIIELIYPRNSRCIIESKSLKLYLNGLAFENFD